MDHPRLVSALGPSNICPPLRNARVAPKPTVTQGCSAFFSPPDALLSVWSLLSCGPTIQQASETSITLQRLYGWPEAGQEVKARAQLCQAILEGGIERKRERERERGRKRERESNTKGEWGQSIFESTDNS